MESSGWEHKVLTDGLAQGLEKAMQLRLHLFSTSPSEAEDLLLQRIISTFEKALYILKWSGHVGQDQLGARTTVDTNKSFRDHHKLGDISKKRKQQPTWTEQAEGNSENGLEGPRDDGYSWRKYGQKDILGAKYPRSYYRCTYRLGRNCWATKQVQRSDDNPTLFEITYKGTHTCNQSSNTVPPPASLEKQELGHENSYYHQLEQQNQTLFNLKANLRVNTENLDIQEIPDHFSFPSALACGTETHCTPSSALGDDNRLGKYSPFFYSPGTSEPNYFSATTYQVKDYGSAPMHHSENTGDIISAHASTTNSPIGRMEFSIDPDLDPNLPFNIPRFFT